MSGLKAYSVFPKDCKNEHAELVFATSAKEARALAWKKPHGDFWCDWIDLRVQREKQADCLAGDTATVVYDDAILREAGWRGDGCDSCDTCGLTDFSDGRNPLWAICPDCYQCGECGHEDDCPSRTK